MKGFKDSTKTRAGHGFDETPTRPATSRDLAAAKAVRIITPGKPTPRVTDSMILGRNEDKAPGEKGARKFAVGGAVGEKRVPFDESFSDKDAYYTPKAAPKAAQTFKQAFAANRAAGKDTFVWNGKRYTTELAGSAPKAAPKATQGSATPVKPPVKSVPVAKSEPLIASKPTARETFRENFARSMGDDSPEAKARLDAKAAARGKALSDAARFVLKGDGKPHPSFRENFARSMGGDKAKRFAVGGLVPPASSGGMPALGKPLTNANVNDARVRPPTRMPTRNSGLPQSWVDNYAADRARRFGNSPQPETRSTGTPPQRPAPPAAQIPYKKGGKVVEKGSKEVYASKAVMKKHEASESKSKERAEHKQEGGELLAGRAQSLRDMTNKPSGRAGYAKGGKSRWS